MATQYGYVRTSTREQNEDRQLIAMREFGVQGSNIFIDKCSGKDFERPAYKQLQDILKPSDIFVIASIDRLGRNYDEILKHWRILSKEKGAEIVVLDMALLDTRLNRDLMGTFISDLVLQILSFVAHSERDSIRKRQAEGIAAAKERGVHMGRPIIKPPDNFYELANLWRFGKLRTLDFMKQTGLSESTLYRRLREYNVFRDEM